MPGIIDLLPLLRGWSMVTRRLSFDDDGGGGLKINPGQEMELISVPFIQGWLISCEVSVRSLYTQAKIITPQQNGATMEIAATAWDIFGGGGGAPVNPGWEKPSILTQISPHSIVGLGAGAQSALTATSIGKLLASLAAGPTNTIDITVGDVSFPVLPGRPVSFRADRANTGNTYLQNGTENTSPSLNSYVKLSPGDAVLFSDFGSLNNILGWQDNGADTLEIAYEAVRGVGLFFNPKSSPQPLFNGFKLHLVHPVAGPQSTGGLSTSGGAPAFPNGPAAGATASIPIDGYGATYVQIDDQTLFKTDLAALRA